MAHVEKRSKNQWRARYRGPDGRERSRTFTTLREANTFAANVTTAQQRGEWVDPKRSKLTVGDWADGFMAGRVHLKPKTIASYESLLDTQIRPTWGRTPLVRISNADVVAWVASMRAAGLSASRTRQSYHLLAAMLDAAVRDRRLASNPAAGIDLPRLPKGERRYLDHGQLQELADVCAEYRTLVLVLGYCGLRFGEAAALRARSVDVLRGRIEISESVTEVNGVAVFGSPKTHQTRSVPVPAFLRDALAAQLKGLAPDAFVFSAPRGGVLRASSFRRQTWNAACITVGLGKMVKGTDGKRRYKGLVPHELRHTAASLAIASGASVKSVQAMLGHGSAVVTLDRYSHLFGDDLDDLAGRMDAAARSAAASPRPARQGNVVQMRRTGL